MPSPADRVISDVNAFDPQNELVITLRRAAISIYERRSIRELEVMLSQLVAAAVDTVPGAVGGGISRTDSGTVRYSHATDDLVGYLDQRQSELNEGPCITAADDPPENGVIWVDDLAGPDARLWPRFAPLAVEQGFRSMVSTHLATSAGGPRSALNLYAAEPGVFDAPARNVAGLFAIQAGALLYGADTAATLTRAIDNRDVIGRAKGILMERFTVGDAEAFQMLVSSSQDTNMKLADIAKWLTQEAEHRQREAATARDMFRDTPDR